MHHQVNRALERSGFRVGTVADFLGLSHEEAEYLELRFGLATALRQRRFALGLSQEEAARVIHTSQAQVARMEGGHRTVTVDRMFRALFQLGVRLRELLRELG